MMRATTRAMSKSLPRLVKAGRVQPIKIGGFLFHETGVDVEGTPDLESYEGAYDFATRAQSFSGFWVADLLRYGSSRPDWTTKISQVQDTTRLSEKTLKNMRAVAAIPISRRRDGVSFAHHSEVSSLDAEEQTEWLEKTAVEGYNVQELRRHIKASKRTRVIEGQAVLRGFYRVIMADCPWSYTDNAPTEDGSLSKAEGAFPGMSIDALCKLPVAAHAMPDSILFFWVTATMLYENPGPREIIEAWGFKPKTGIVWDKVLGMPGHYGFQVKHEHLIIATRGSALPNAPTPHHDSIQVIRRQGEHSEKPEDIRKIIMKHWTVGPYLELFGRHPQEGWDVYGNDARLWGAT